MSDGFRIEKLRRDHPVDGFSCGTAGNASRVGNPSLVRVVAMDVPLPIKNQPQLCRTRRKPRHRNSKLPTTNLSQIVTDLHPQPDIRRPAERFSSRSAISGVTSLLPFITL